MSIAYYDENAEAFFRDTIDTGWDAKAFHVGGYQVVAFDGSAELVRLARAYSGLPVIHMSFDDMDWSAPSTEHGRAPVCFTSRERTCRSRSNASPRRFGPALLSTSP